MPTICPGCLGFPMTVGKQLLGESSPASPIFTNPEPLSTIKAGFVSSILNIQISSSLMEQQSYQILRNYHSRPREVVTPFTKIEIINMGFHFLDFDERIKLIAMTLFCLLLERRTLHVLQLLICSSLLIFQVLIHQILDHPSEQQSICGLQSQPFSQRTQQTDLIASLSLKIKANCLFPAKSTTYFCIMLQTSILFRMQTQLQCSFLAYNRKRTLSPIYLSHLRITVYFQLPGNPLLPIFKTFSYDFSDDGLVILTFTYFSFNLCWKRRDLLTMQSIEYLQYFRCHLHPLHIIKTQQHGQQLTINPSSHPHTQERKQTRLETNSQNI